MDVVSKPRIWSRMMDIYISSLMDSRPLSIRLHRVHPRLDDINSLLRELSGPRPLCRGVDIVSKSRIWGDGASAISFETQPTFQTLHL